MTGTEIGLALSVFAACAVDAVEALTIVLAVGTTRSWSSALYGALAAAIALAVTVLALGPALGSLAGTLRLLSVLGYAVAVFVSFLAGLLAMARFSRRRGAHLLYATNMVGAVVVAFTLIVNTTRGYPLLALAGTVLVAAFLHWRW